MSYEIITYSPDTGTDEHGDYRTQKEARRGHWPAGALPIERGCNA